MTRPDVTLLLHGVRAGEPLAAERLMEVVYAELRDVAGAKMNRERAGHTLQPTALVNEAFLRLVDDERSLANRQHFFRAAALAMERVLVDHARARKAQKRGGDAARVTLDEMWADAPDGSLDVLEIQEVLARLGERDEELAHLVRCRYFLGMELDEVARVLDLSLATVKRRWTFARAWLFERLQGGPGGA